jgi:hypothetical protein
MVDEIMHKLIIEGKREEIHADYLVRWKTDRKAGSSPDRSRNF